MSADGTSPYRTSAEQHSRTLEGSANLNSALRGRSITDHGGHPITERVNVCPRCSNGRPTCRTRRADGTRYTHAETCDKYRWATDVCDACKVDSDPLEPPCCPHSAASHDPEWGCRDCRCAFGGAS